MATVPAAERRSILRVCGNAIDDPVRFLADAARRRERLEDIQASGLDLRGQRLEGLSVLRGMFEDCRFDVARIDDADLERVEFRSGSLVCATLRQARLRSVRFGRVRIAAEIPYPTLAGPGVAELAEAAGNGMADEHPADLAGLDLSRAVLTDVEIVGCVLRNAILAFSSLRRVAFEDCDMAGAILRDVDAEGGGISRCGLDGAALSVVRWDEGTFEDVSASNTSVFDAHFRRCLLLGEEPCSALRDAIAGRLADKAWRLSREVLEFRP